MATDGTDAWGGLEVHPGYTLRQEIEARGLTQRGLATRMGRPEQVISDIFNGRKSITASTATELERVLDIPAYFWVDLVRQHDLAIGRIAERKRLQHQTALLKDFRANELMKRGWMPRVNDKAMQVKELCKFLGVASLEVHAATLPASFRITGGERYSDRTLAVWLRRGELLALQAELPAFDPTRFRAILEDIRALTVNTPDDFDDQMMQLCASAGVALVFVQELPKVGANGVTRWLHRGNPMIQLNLKWKWADIFWFTFFHEAGHVLQPKRHDVMHYGKRQSTDTRYEDAASKFATDILIPPTHWKHICGELIMYNTSQRVRELAHEAGVHPGIVVGRLQHERRIRYSEMNDLRAKFKWSQ